MLDKDSRYALSRQLRKKVQVIVVLCEVQILAHSNRESTKPRREAIAMGHQRRGRKVTRKTDTHHWLWPKKLYRHNRTIEMDYDVHHGYHSFFMRNCVKNIADRDCLHGFCRYASKVCCYAETRTPLGEKLKLGDLL